MARKTILVVDDEKPQRDILQEILTSAGYDVTSAASGEAALKFAKDRSFDLALTPVSVVCTSKIPSASRATASRLTGSGFSLGGRE